MSLENNLWTYIAGGAIVILGGAAIASASSSKKPKAKSIYMPGETVHAFMGQMITVRLPRGDYSVVADKVSKLKAVDIGANTDVVVVVSGAHASFQERVNFVPLGGTKLPLYINVIARPQVLEQ